MEILSFAENAIHPKVDVVKGHVPFKLMGFALVEKYGNPDFSDSFLRYEYAQFGNFEVDLNEAQGVDAEGNATPLDGLVDEDGNPVEVGTEPQIEKLEILLNRDPTAVGVEPITVLYYGNYSVPQS